MASVKKRTWTHNGIKKEAWTVRYIDKSGVHRSKACGSKKDADAYCRNVENELEAGTHIARTQTVTVAQLTVEYLEYLDDRLNNGVIGRTSRQNQEGLLMHVLGAFASVRLTELPWQSIQAFAAQLRRTRAPHTGRVYSVATVLSVVKTFRLMMDYAVRRDYVARNVVEIALKALDLGTKNRIVPFAKDEIKAILSIAGERSWAREEFRVAPFMKAVVFIATFCGLRLGEIMALRACDIDFEQGMLRVRHSLTKFDELKEPKTSAGIRDVPLPSYVAEAIRAYMALAVPDKRGLIFRSRVGGHVLGGSFVRAGWASLLQRAGVAKDPDGTWRHIHALRHFAGSSWLEAGIPLADVSRLLGHANTAVTAQVYMHALGTNHTKAALLESTGATLLPPPRLQIAQELRTAA